MNKDDDNEDNEEREDYQYHREFDSTEIINYTDKNGNKVTKKITTKTVVNYSRLKASL